MRNYDTHRRRTLIGMGWNQIIHDGKPLKRGQQDQFVATIVQLATGTLAIAGTSGEINEGVSAIEYLGEEIERTAQTVKESIEKTSIFDHVYDDMETYLYASFFIKAFVLLVVCSLQCWLFMKLMGKKVLEYKRVSIPI